MQRISCFPPIVDSQSRILILGSVPGAKSLEMSQYYAHPQNQFWKILFRLFDVRPTDDYQKKIDFLKNHKIALWDVIESCERKGSQDTAIKNEKDNNIAALIHQHPNIQAIFCNGQKSYKNLNKTVGKDLGIPIMVLPSTSPLHTIGFDRKLEQWTVIKDML